MLPHVTVDFSKESELSTPRYCGVPSSFFSPFFHFYEPTICYLRLGVYKQVEPVFWHLFIRSPSLNHFLFDVYRRLIFFFGPTIFLPFISSSLVVVSFVYFCGTLQAERLSFFSRFCFCMSNITAFYRRWAISQPIGRTVVKFFSTQISVGTTFEVSFFLPSIAKLYRWVSTLSFFSDFVFQYRFEAFVYKMVW